MTSNFFADTSLKLMKWKVKSAFRTWKKNTVGSYIWNVLIIYLISESSPSIF